MDIGSWTLNSKLILAPMAGVTDFPFRQCCREHGAAMAVSEMVTSDPSLLNSRKTRLRLSHKRELEPVVVQILGTEPDSMAEAAKYNADNGAHIIDINMGCPAKKVCKKAAGSALLRDESKVAKILHAVVRAVDIPVTLKIRTGWSPEERNAPQIAKIAEAAGVAAITVHGRTRACQFKGQAEYQTIRLVKQGVNIPVIANGDITTGKQAEKVLSETGADALMIGRGALGWPWIFNEINTSLAKTPWSSPDLMQQKEVIFDLLQGFYQFYGEKSGVRIARKHIGWYLDRASGGAAYKNNIYKAETIKQQLAAINLFFNSPVAQHTQENNQYVTRCG